MNFVTYQCTICRRTKGIEKNNTHVQPDQCTITKGCLGRLLAVGETNEMKSTPSVSGVEDWYQRGSIPVKTEEKLPPTQMALSTSASGSLTMAIKSDNPSTLPIQMFVHLEQKKVGPIEFQQYLFKVNAGHQQATTVLSGKDSNGKNLRFTAEAVAEGRIQIRVNGVPNTDVVFTPQTIITFNTLLPIGTIVDVIVANSTDTDVRSVVFTRNKSLIPSLARGSWSNIDYVEMVDELGVAAKWYLYSTDSLGPLSRGTIKMVGNDLTDEVIYLLASTPYQSMDRYLNFIVPQAILADGFHISYEDGQLMVLDNLRKEIFPPFTLEIASYISADLYTTTTSSQVVTDTELIRFKSNKILGPV